MGVAPPRLHTIRLDFFDYKDRPLARYQQVWHFINLTKGEMPILFMRSVSDIHNQNKKS